MPPHNSPIKRTTVGICVRLGVGPRFRKRTAYLLAAFRDCTKLWKPEESKNQLEFRVDQLHKHSNFEKDRGNMEYETISIIIPPKPGEEHLYPKDAPITMDIACRSMSSSLEKEADLAASKLPFTWKLYEMLDNVAENGQEHIVSWVNNGRGFRVHNMDAFTKEIIPIYFKQSKYKSFQRQLYFYNFKRVSKGSAIGSYYHPLFVRGNKTKVLSMTPKKNTRKKGGTPTSSPCVQEDENSFHRKVSDEVCEQPFFSQSEEMPESCRRVSVMEPSDLQTYESDSRSSRDEDSLFEPWQECRNFHNRIHDTTRDIRRVNRVSFTEEQDCSQSPQFVQHHWQNFLDIPVNYFEPHDGETCQVFGDMSFHFVAGVPTF